MPWEHRLRPAGIPEHVKPRPGNMQTCPACGYKRFDYMAAGYGACERRKCGYEWHAGHEVESPQGLTG